MKENILDLRELTDPNYDKFILALAMVLINGNENQKLVTKNQVSTWLLRLLSGHLSTPPEDKRYRNYSPADCAKILLMGQLSKLGIEPSKHTDLLPRISKRFEEIYASQGNVGTYSIAIETIEGEVVVSEFHSNKDYFKWLTTPRGKARALHIWIEIDSIISNVIKAIGVSKYEADILFVESEESGKGMLAGRESDLKALYDNCGEDGDGDVDQLRNFIADLEKLIADARNRIAIVEKYCL